MLHPSGLFCVRPTQESSIPARSSHRCVSGHDTHPLKYFEKFRSTSRRLAQLLAWIFIRVAPCIVAALISFASSPDTEKVHIEDPPWKRSTALLFDRRALELKIEVGQGSKVFSGLVHAYSVRNIRLVNLCSSSHKANLESWL